MRYEIRIVSYRGNFSFVKGFGVIILVLRVLLEIKDVVKKAYNKERIL